MTEKITKEYIASLIQSRRPVILDIGCYDCKDSLELAKLLPAEARFHCFEADARSLEYANKNMYGEHKGNFSLWHFAMNAYDGRVRLNISNSNTRRHEGKSVWCASSSIQEPKEHLTVFPDVRFTGYQVVDSVKLDTWYATSLNPKFIDYMHVDVNGAEGHVIQGGLKTINDKVRYLYIEFQEKPLYESAPNKADIRDLLPGFEEIGVFDFHGNFGNVLLQNKNI